MKYQCPECGDGEAIDLEVLSHVRLIQTEEGFETDADLAERGDHEFDDATLAICAACGHAEALSAFDTQPDDDDEKAA